MSASVIFLLLLQSILASGHKGVKDPTEEQLNAPVDPLLWIHITLQTLVWGVIFPTGMVLGISRSRWHVPVQVSTVHP